MKQLKRILNPYGLHLRLVKSLLLSIILCIIVFFALQYATETMLYKYFEKTDFQRTHYLYQFEELQDYITSNSIGSDDMKELRAWQKKHPLVLLEIYSDKECIYSSFARYVDYSDLSVPEVTGKDDNIFKIKLADKEATVLLYSDFAYKYYLLASVLSFIIALLLLIILFITQTIKLINYINKLSNEVQILADGNLDYNVTVQGNDELTDLARNMNDMRQAFKEQLDKEQALYVANRQLVTEMSHDLRTPLTSIMLYVELLRGHRYESESQMEEYLEKIDTKAHQMKLLSDHLFEYNLKGGQPNLIKPLSIEQALSENVSNLASELTISGYKVQRQLNWPAGFIQVQSDYMNRIFENIMSNITKYAEPDADIIITALDSNNYCGLSFLNSCRISEISRDSDDDVSAPESTGIGLESIRTLMRQMGGITTVDHTESAFEISLYFPKC